MGTRRSVGRASLVVVAGVVVWVMGCSGGDDGTDGAASTTGFVVETEDGTQAFSRDGGAGSFNFEGDDGRGTLTFDLDGDGVVSEGDGGAFELTPGAPSGWPTDFPLPPGAEIVGGNMVEAGPLRQLTTVYRLADPGREVVAFYEAELDDWLPLVDVLDDRDESYRASVSFEGDEIGFVSVATVDGGSELAVQLIVEDG